MRRVSFPSVVERRRFRWRGAIGVCLLAPAAIVASLSEPLVAANSRLDFACDALAWVAFLCGAGLRFWATLFVGGRKNEVVVADGPYSLCRHPLYLASIVLGFSGALFLKSPLLAVASAVLAAAYCLLTIPVEEEHLSATLGVPYRDYCTRVNRLWPSFRQFQTPPRVTIDVHALYLEAARASRWVWLPLIGAALGHARAAGWWPQLFTTL